MPCSQHNYSSIRAGVQESATADAEIDELFAELDRLVTEPTTAIPPRSRLNDGIPPPVDQATLDAIDAEIAKLNRELGGAND